MATKKTKANEIKKNAENLMQKRLLWDEYATSGRLLSHGTFALSDAIIIVIPKDIRGCKISCCSSNNFLSYGEWMSQKRCDTCPNRTGFIKEASGISDVLNNIELDTLCLAEDDKRMRRNDASLDTMIVSTYSTPLVPKGCPHAFGGCLLGNLKEAKSVFLRADNRMSPIPISWKLTKNEDKIDLCIQFRTFYAKCANAFDDVRLAKESLYQHITCDISTGMTYVSDIHSPTRHVHKNFANGKNTSVVENITYTGTSNNLFQQFAAHTISSKSDLDEITRAFKMMFNEVSKALHEKFYCKGFTMADPFPDENNDIVRDEFNGITTYQNYLREIATINRFPLLGFLPLQHLRDVAPLYVKRRFDKLPRDVKRDELAALLNLPQSEALSFAYSRVDGSFEKVAMLVEYGINDISYLEKSIGVQVKTDANTGQSRAMLDNAAFVFLGAVGDVSMEKCDALSLASPMALIDLKINRTFIRPTPGEFDRLDLLLKANNIDLEELVATQAEQALCKGFSKKGEKWTFTMEKCVFSLTNTFNSYIFIKAKNSDSLNDDECINITVIPKLYLDRRCWTKKAAKEFFEALDHTACMANKSTNEQFFYDQVDFTDALISHENKPMQKMIMRLVNSLRVSFCVTYVENKYDKKKVETNSAIDMKTCADILYTWADKSNVDVLPTVDTKCLTEKKIEPVQVGKSVRKMRERRARERKTKQVARARAKKLAEKISLTEEKN